MKRSRIQLYLYGLLAGSLLVGCTAGPVEEIVPEEAQLVMLSFGKPDLGVPAVLTRADETVTTPTPLPVGTTVRIGAYFTGNVGDKQQPASFATDEPSFEATYRIGDDGALTPCRVDDAGKVVEGEAKGLQVRGGVYDFYAVSPARKLLKGADNNYKITGIPHKEDVMDAFARGVAVAKESRVVTLGTFRRKCALVVFNVAPSPDNALPFETLYGTKLELKKISSSGASLIAGEDTGIPPTGGSEEEEARIVFAAEEFERVESDLDNIGLNKTKGILIPKNNRPFDMEITVVRDNETATLKATIDKNISFDEGKRYVFTLEVKNNESSLLMKVLDWNAIAFKDDNVGGPDEPYPDPDVNEGIGTTIVVAKWTEIPWSGNGEIGGN
ncbi:MAG: fimbrillin family protein [Parabacteroides gordonii]|nr:fimbrillin family protein [Parabacteroides gordonii]